MVRSRWAGGVDIDDVVQEVLASLHAVRHTYDPNRPFLPWLKTLASNRLVDAQRRHMRRSSREVVVDTPPETFPLDPTNSNEAGDDAKALHAAIRHLPKGQREAVEMLKLRELTLKEAAAESGMTVAALKVAMHRALKSLRTALKPSG
jgi:RNA polymerase sigma-70 factor (ECF subfamily)